MVKMTQTRDYWEWEIELKRWNDGPALWNKQILMTFRQFHKRPFFLTQKTRSESLQVLCDQQRSWYPPTNQFHRCVKSSEQETAEFCISNVWYWRCLDNTFSIHSNKININPINSKSKSWCSCHNRSWVRAHNSIYIAGHVGLETCQEAIG